MVVALHQESHQESFLVSRKFSCFKKVLMLLVFLPDPPITLSAVERCFPSQESGVKYKVYEFTVNEWTTVI